MKKLLVLTALAATLVSAPASAQIYLGAGVAESRTDKDENAWKLYAGYQFTPTWGVELGYTDLGTYRRADIESWSLALTGTMPLSQHWSLLGKVGEAANSASFSGSSDRTDLYFGLGVGYAMSKNFGLRIEYENFGKLSSSRIGSNSTGSDFGVSVKYSY